MVEMSATAYRRQPRARSLVGFEIDAPTGVQLADGSAVVCREQRPDGRPLGEIELSTFETTLIIDRDGVLAERASAGLGQEGSTAGAAVAVPVQLPGASGFRADGVVRGAALPYRSVFVLAPSDLGLRGGVTIVVRSAVPDWASAEHILRSLRMLSTRGVIPSDGDADAGPILPFAG